MPTLEMKNEHEVIITHECNWDCPYCSESTHEKEKLKDQEVLDKLSLIPDNVPVTISGGEPGLVDEEHLHTIINILKEKHCELMLNTNGLFLRNYPHLIIYFKYILYHCSEDLKEEIEIFDYDNVYHALVVTDENVYRLENVLYNKSFKWEIIPASNPRKSDKPELSSKNRMMILLKYSNLISDDSKIRLLREKKWDEIVFL